MSRAELSIKWTTILPATNQWTDHAVHILFLAYINSHPVLTHLSLYSYPPVVCPQSIVTHHFHMSHL